MTDEFDVIPPKCNRKNWGALLDHGLEKTASYIIRETDSIYQCLDGSTGKISLEDVSAAVVIQYAIDQLASTGGTILIKKGTYFITVEITIDTDEKIALVGEGRRFTILRAINTIDSIISAKDRKLIYVGNMSVDGDNYATIGLDFGSATSAAREHFIYHSFLRGAKTANLDLTGCEDSVVERCRIHGDDDGVAACTEYGLITGGTDGVHTNGLITITECIFGFHKYGDVHVADVEHVRFYGGVFATLPADCPDMKAEIVIDGTGPVEFFGSWFEGSDVASTIPNILIENSPCRELGLYGVRMFGNNYPNVYSALTSPNRACWSLITVGGVIEPRGSNYAIQCPAYNLVVNGTDLVSTGSSESLVDITNVAYYMINDRTNNWMMTNKVLRMYPSATAAAGIEGKANEQVKITATGSSGGGLLLNYGSTRPIFVGGNVGGVGPEYIRLTPVEGDVHCDKDLNLQGTMRIKNPKYFASGTISGTPIVVEIVVNDQIYYFYVYPTKV